MISLVIGDTRPDIVIEVWDGGAPLADASFHAYEFRLRKPSGAVVTIPLTVLNGPKCIVGGSFGPGAVDEEGLMRGELVITFTDGRVQHGEEPFDVFVRREYFEANL